MANNRYRFASCRIAERPIFQDRARAFPKDVIRFVLSPHHGGTLANRWVSSAQTVIGGFAAFGQRAAADELLTYADVICA